jgi:hypothetical protein
LKTDVIKSRNRIKSTGSQSNNENLPSNGDNSEPRPRKKVSRKKRLKIETKTKNNVNNIFIKTNWIEFILVKWN